MTQYDIILSAMINHPEKEFWTAVDFQKGKYFVGYEASARMSELAKMIPEIFIVGRQDRFRTLAIDWTNEHTQDYIDMYKED